MAEQSSQEKPAVLIIGGLGYIGRFLAKHIHTNGLASEMRIVDRAVPEIASLADEFKECCSRKYFVQADACNERKSLPQILLDILPKARAFVDKGSLESMPKIFDRENGKQFDYVFNCGGESRHSQSDETYRIRSYSLSQRLARECLTRRISAIVECSTGMVYAGSSPTPSKEASSIKPWTPLATWRVKAAAEFKDIEGLNLVALRLANVYGPYATGSMATVLCLGRVYKELGGEMKWLWDKDLRAHTVHVEDVARALWTAGEWKGRGAGRGVSRIPDPEDKGKSLYPVFNIVDHGDTTQGLLAELIKGEFGIETGFHGKLKSIAARINLDSIVEEENDVVLEVWSELVEQSDKIKRKGAVPISPFVEAELLQEKHLSMDGGLFEKIMGFTYDKERLDSQQMKEVVESYERLGWWP